MPDFDGLKKAELTPDQNQPRIRRLSILAIVPGLILIVFAAGCILTTLVFRPKVVEGPIGTNEVASQITDWTLPRGFEGKSGTTLDNAMFRIDIAKFRQQQGRGVLILGWLQSKLITLPDQREQTQELIERISPELKKINVSESTKRTQIIRGLPAEFNIGSGEDLASTTRYRQVIGYFRGKRDDAILILQFEEEILTDLEVDEFLKSIE